MTKELDDFSFRNGGGSDHDWTTFLNGAIWRIRQGEDFTCKPTSFAQQARSAAKKAGCGLRVALRSDDEGGYVILQAYNRVDGETQASEPAIPSKKAKKKAD